MIPAWQGKAGANRIEIFVVGRTTGCPGESSAGVERSRQTVSPTGRSLLISRPPGKITSGSSQELLRDAQLAVRLRHGD
jgi:hypothetical protein